MMREEEFDDVLCPGCDEPVDIDLPGLHHDGDGDWHESCWARAVQRGR